MNWLLWVLTILGALVGIVLLLLVCLIFGKIRLVIDYRAGELKLWLQWLFLKYTVYPDPEKQEIRQARRKEIKQRRQQRKTKATATKSPTGESAPKVTQTKKSGLRRAARREVRKAVQSVPVKEYARTLQIIVTRFIAKFHCKSLVLYASLGGSEASEIAMEYGTVNALLYPVLGAFSAAGRLHRCDVQITPDFTSEETHAEGRAVFTFRLFQAFRCIWELSETLYDENN